MRKPYVITYLPSLTSQKRTKTCFYENDRQALEGALELIESEYTDGLLISVKAENSPSWAKPLAPPR